MSTAFSKSFAALLADRGLSQSVTLAAAVLALAGWGWWAARSEVTLYEVSKATRLELDSATYPVQSPFAGKIVRTSLSVGKEVKRGDILVEIDSEPDHLQLRQEQIRAFGLGPEVARLRSQLASEERAREQEQRSARAAAEEAANKIVEAETAAKYAETELARAQRLHEESGRRQRARYTETSMRFALLSLACILTAGAQESDSEGISWLDNYKAALAEAKRTQKPIFLEFRCEA